MISILPKHIKNVPVATYSKKKNVPIILKDHILFVFNDITIGLVDSSSESCTTELLVGHNKPITAMCISLNSQFICSCCTDTVIIWDIGEIFLSGNGGAKPKKFIVGVELGPIEFCALSQEWLALGQDGRILIIFLQFQAENSGMKELLGVEEYATFPLRQKTSLACFLPSQPNLLVVAEDNTFKILDVSSSQLVYQSPGFGTHALTFCSFTSRDNTKLVLGTNKGQVHVFNVTDLDVFSPWNVISVDVCKTLTQMECINDDDFGERSGEVGYVVFSAKLYSPMKINEEASNSKAGLFENEQFASTLRSILAPGSMLIVFSNRGITIFDCKSADCLTHLHISELVPRRSLSMVEFGVLAGESLDKLTCLVKSSEREADISIVSLQCSDVTYVVPESTSSVIPIGPVKASSVLRRQMKLSPERSAYNSKEEKWRSKETPSKTSLSSCYGKPTLQKMFIPLINDPNKRTKSTQTQQLPQSSILSARLTDINSLQNSGPPKQSVQEVCVSETAWPIRLASSGDGNFLACTTSLSAICILPFKNFDLEKSVNLIGHDSTVNALHFNLDSKWLISCSKDSTTKVWDWKNKKCVMSIDKKKDTKNQHQKQSSSGNPDIIDASFYYMDQFLLVASGNCLDMYCHQLNEPNAKPCSSGLFRNKLVHTAQAPSQNITCFSAANQLHSYVALCGCSDKSVRVYDMNAECFCAVLADVHARPPHSLRQVTGSACSVEMHDLFLTAAVADCVRLWDLRSARCIQKYSRHVMRSYTAGIDVSPCARYVAVGSEDKSVYIYDTRHPEDYLGKLAVRGDVAMDVAFSPNKPLLAASSLNGHVTRFSA